MHTPTRGGDVAIIGAGLIGLAIAFELAERGAVVRLFERGEPGRAASWAGAGMLAPHTERLDDEALLALCVESLAMYPDFTRRIAEASGIDPKLTLTGIVQAAYDDDGMRALDDHEQRLRAQGVACERLDRRETIAAEPLLSKDVRGALVVRSEGAVDNRRLGRALEAACESRGIRIMRACGEVTVECDDRRVLGVRSDLGFASAAFVVNAAGAWSASVPGIPLRALPPVVPGKGQMLALAVPRAALNRTTWVPGAYLVPRDDGRLLVGATVEHEGFDARVTAGGVRALLDSAIAAAPSLGHFAITETWAGLRPGTPDGRPFIGPTPIDGLLLATGHYRNGILLTPVTASTIGRYIETGDPAALEPWLLARLGTEGGARTRMTVA